MVLGALTDGRAGDEGTAWFGKGLEQEGSTSYVTRKNILHINVQHPRSKKYFIVDEGIKEVL